jgi:hypothetical protein
MRTSVHIPDDLLKRAKKKAAADGRTLTSLIEEGLRLVLARTDRGKSASKAARALPISRHAGGLRAGTDLDRFSDLQEIEDIEYAERIRKGFK